ncbi:DUF1822 family protein [Chamaesiphon sp. VAR_48_metabat_135_sub]|uniref:DUF1822 family protein n=1 Tax=Chamaesiphon sp. VAR_48_metabat_135_sub TaxID=2964699 RepID=UPI00286CF44B|nr:DUF1822 family protein [Chamaesiphon sp. VAR_48_metabat_135_sub]
MFSALVESTDWTLQIPDDRQANIWQQSRAFPTAWGRWNAYLNQLCLETCLAWLKAEYLPTAKAGMEPALWGMVNGSIVTVGNLRIALMPTESIDRSELEVPQEWVDIPSWAADYYLGVQVAPDCQELTIYGYATHQQLKTQASYDAQDRTYCLDVDDLITDLNTLWLAYPHYTTNQTRASLPALSPLAPERATQLIERLGNPALVMPRLEVPFQIWAALLENPQSRQRLLQQIQTGNSTPVFTQLSSWFQGQMDEVWKSIDRVLLSQQIESAVRGEASQNLLRILSGDVYRAKILNLDRGQIALVIGISPVSETEIRINLQVHPSGGDMYLPGETQLRLLTTEGIEIGKVSATAMETIQLQFLVSVGEQFAIEIICCGQTLVERFEL